MTPRSRNTAQPGSLFDELSGGREAAVSSLGEGAKILRGLAEPIASQFIQLVDELTAAAPFRNMVTPGGRHMSVAISNCGEVGWISDRDGYRYDAIDPKTGQPWPHMPDLFRDLAARAAAEGGFPNFKPNACLINRYEPGTRLSLHQDKDELDLSQPIVSVSLGLPAVFLFGGLRRSDKTRRIRLESGDVVVWGGPARLTYHGVAPLAPGSHPLTGTCRINLTFRKAL